MIPKTLIYCNFGNMKLREELELKCMKTWERCFPKSEWNWVELNESNFDYNSIPYTKEAYKLKKYSAVADYARLKYLYENGGVYVDTDLYMIKPLDEEILEKSFMGLYKDQMNQLLNFKTLISWGIVGFEKGNKLIKNMKETYESFNNYCGIKETDVSNKALIEEENFKTIKPIYNLDKIDLNNLIIYNYYYFTCNNTVSIRIKTKQYSYAIHLYSNTWTNNPLKNKCIEKLYIWEK